MSTATVATVRPITAIKADMADTLANNSLARDAANAVAWVPRKIAAGLRAAVEFLRLPQILNAVKRYGKAFLDIVGRRTFLVHTLTGESGQAMIRTTTKGIVRLTGWTIATSWKIVTWPLRQITPVGNALARVDDFAFNLTHVEKKSGNGVNRIPASIKVAGLVVGEYVSAKRIYMKTINIVTTAIVLVRLTRRFVPAGPFRWITYALEAPVLLSRIYALPFVGSLPVPGSWARATETTTRDVEQRAETVIAEASTLTREAAMQRAVDLNNQADQVLTEARQQAEEMRRNAEAAERTAARLEAAEKAKAGKAEQTEEIPASVLVEEHPTPGPSAPPMGGRTPGAGPQPPQHQKHGQRGTKPPSR